MKIYLVRHGETEWNVEGRLQGKKNSQLTKKGIDDAKALQKKLKEVHFSKIYSSPLQRAKETAKILKGEREIGITLDPLLEEMGFGVWEGKSRQEIEEFWYEEFFHFWNEPQHYTPVDESGEEFNEVCRRTDEFLRKIHHEKRSGAVLVVAHGVVIKCIYARIKNLPLKDLWSPPFPKGTSLTIIEKTSDGESFLLEADTSHLNENT